MQSGHKEANCHVFAYARVSTNLQALADTIENQQKAVKEFAIANDMTIIKWYTDEGISGTTGNRPGLQEMLSRLDEVDGVLVFDADRLVRDEILGINIMLTMMSHNKLLYSVRAGTTNFNEPVDRLMYLIRSWANSEEARKIKQRQKQGIARFKVKNGYWGRRKMEPNWKKLGEFRKAGVTRAACARIFGMSPRTLKRRLDEREAQRRGGEL